MLQDVRRRCRRQSQLPQAIQLVGHETPAPRNDAYVPWQDLRGIGHFDRTILVDRIDDDPLTADIARDRLPPDLQNFVDAQIGIAAFVAIGAGRAGT